MKIQSFTQANSNLIAKIRTFTPVWKKRFEANWKKCSRMPNGSYFLLNRFSRKMKVKSRASFLQLFFAAKFFWVATPEIDLFAANDFQAWQKMI